MRLLACLQKRDQIGELFFGELFFQAGGHDADAAGLHLFDVGPNQEVRVARADIEEMKPSSVSIMPAGLEKQLTKEQLADLIAFLKACK